MKIQQIEDTGLIPFYKKIPVTVARGEGAYVYDEQDQAYIDLTSGWGVTCLGHSHPAVVAAIHDQSKKIMLNPCSGLTYSPARADVIVELQSITPTGLNKFFFTNSGAESNDAAIKMARKFTNRKQVLSLINGFHGRTISTLTATGQPKHHEKFNVLMPHNQYLTINDISQLESALSDQIAAVILEPIQGEGGIHSVDIGYMNRLRELCDQYGVVLIFDEVQTGFYRTGKAFGALHFDVIPDIMTMAKGIASGFPFGAIAMAEPFAEKVELGDHGGTYCGNPLGCAVAAAVIKTLKTDEVQQNLLKIEQLFSGFLTKIEQNYSHVITEIRGRGAMWAIQFKRSEDAEFVLNECLEKRLFVNLTQGNVIRFLPSLTVQKNVLESAFEIIESTIKLLDSSVD